jgi:4a-hydroxytetrahydrobiopterin dehydratase
VSPRRSTTQSIQKEYKFKNFKEVVSFFNRIAALAEEENHHPELKIGYNRLAVELSTHSVKGLTENDFILAAKFDVVRSEKGGLT